MKTFIIIFMPTSVAVLWSYGANTMRKCFFFFFFFFLLHDKVANSFLPKSGHKYIVAQILSIVFMMH